MAKYDRDTAVAAVASLYEFFAALPTSTPTVIKYPPPDGWPDITPENLAPLGKNDDVIDLYKHLPYPSAHIEIASSTSPTWWYYRRFKSVLENRSQFESIGPVGAGEIPEHVAILTVGNRDGSWLFLDTKNGMFGSLHSRPFSRFSTSTGRLYRWDLTRKTRHNHRLDTARVS
jgi:hypothetical protein